MMEEPKPSNFEIALKFTLDAEGGFSNDPADSGGATNYGITQSTYNDWRNSHNLSYNSVRFITKDEVKHIYRTNYWDKAGCDFLPLDLAIVVFDFAVHSGPSRAVRYLGLSKDAQNYIDLRERFLRAIVNRKPSQEKFWNGWKNRLNKLRKYIQEVAA